MKRFRFILLFVFFFCSRHRFISTACMANELGVFYETHFFVTTFSPQIKNKYNFTNNDIINLKKSSENKKIIFTSNDSATFKAT